MGFALPIGRLRRARQSLREQHNLLEVLLDSLDVAVVACDADGRLTHANRRTRELCAGVYPLGLQAGQWVERFHVRTPDGQPFPTQDLPLVRALRGEVVRAVDVLADAGGTDRLLCCSATPVADDGGRRLGAVVLLEDVSEQRARDARIREELGDLGIALDIQEAAEAGRLVLHAQPIIGLASGETVLEELLLRLRLPDGTIVGPGDFLAAAERHGTVTSLDRWVFEQAADLAAQGRRVTVNVSAHTVSTPGFLAAVEETLACRELEPSLITFEITETAIVSDIVQASRFAERLHEIGCLFALDDFGTGYAAFTYLKHLPVRYLKIDMEFVRDLRDNPRSRAVVSGIVALAAGFGQRTIAEGVEDAATLELLRELGVDLAQGFHIGEPSPITP